MKNNDVLETTWCSFYLHVLFLFRPLIGKPTFVHWVNFHLAIEILLQQQMLEEGEFSDPWKSKFSLSSYVDDIGNSTSTLSLHVCVLFKTSPLSSKNVSFIFGSQELRASPDTWQALKILVE